MRSLFRQKTEALLRFHGIGYAKKCLSERHPRARLHRKMRSRTGVAVQPFTRAKSALLEPVGSGNMQTASWLYFIDNSRTASLHVGMALRNGFTPCSQLESLNGVVGTVTTEKEVDKTAWERSGAVHLAMRLLTSHFFSLLHTLFGNNSLCTLDDDGLLE